MSPARAKAGRGADASGSRTTGERVRAGCCGWLFLMGLLSVGLALFTKPEPSEQPEPDPDAAQESERATEPVVPEAPEPAPWWAELELPEVTLAPYQAEESGSIARYLSRRFVLEPWHLVITEQIAGRGRGTRWFELRVTDGVIAPTGVYHTYGDEPGVDFWHHTESEPRFELVTRNLMTEGALLSLAAGELAFEVPAGRGQEPEQPLRAMLELESLDYEYVGRTGKEFQGELPLGESFSTLLRLGLELCGELSAE